MTESPERIWAWPAGNAASTSIFPYDEDTDSSGLVEYIRADLYAALEAENERLRKVLSNLLAPFADDECRKDHHGYCQAHFLEEDCCVAAARRALKGDEWLASDNV